MNKLCSKLKWRLTKELNLELVQHFRDVGLFSSYDEDEENLLQTNNGISKGMDEPKTLHTSIPRAKVQVRTIPPYLMSSRILGT